jgi:hypothetical protein
MRIPVAAVALAFVSLLLGAGTAAAAPKFFVSAQRYRLF